MLPDFTSRCTNPARCAAPNAPATSTPIATARASSTAAEANTLSRSWPSTSSITRPAHARTRDPDDGVS